MGKLFKTFFATTVAIAAVVVYRESGPPTEPEIMDDDVWWGPGERSVDHGNTVIRPFRIDISTEIIDDLKNRLSNVRLTEKPLETVNFEYGFNGDHLKKVIDHWSNRYNWTNRQTYLNTLPQYKTRIDGLNLHFVHVKPKPSVAKTYRTIPLLMLHGWPGSVVEFYKIIPMLTKPHVKHDFVFEVIAPSLPGYGFSDASARPGMGPAQMGQMFVKLMERLGHHKFYVQGGNWGAFITEAISKIFPDRVYGMHSNMCIPLLTLCDISLLALGSYWPSLVISSEVEQSRVYPLSKVFMTLLEESGYNHIQTTKPDTVGVALNDSPSGLAAYILEKFSGWTHFDNKHLSDGGLSKYDTDELLDNVMIYWLTGSITTSMRLYSEFGSKKYQALPHLKTKVNVPAACALFPYEMTLTLSLKTLLKRKFTNLVKATEIDEGGHFAAFEQPKLLAEDIYSSILEMETIRFRV